MKFFSFFFFLYIFEWKPFFFFFFFTKAVITHKLLFSEFHSKILFLSNLLLFLVEILELLSYRLRYRKLTHVNIDQARINTLPTPPKYI